MGWTGEGLQREPFLDSQVETTIFSPVVSQNSWKLQQFLQRASNFCANAINFAGKTKSYSTINSKSGTKQQRADTGLQHLALNSEILISPINSGLCLMFTPAYILKIQPSGHSVNTPQYLLQLVFD